VTNGLFRFSRPLLAIAMVGFIAAGCSDDDDDDGGGGTGVTQGNLQVFATDAPPELDRLQSVELSIQRVEAISAVATGQTTNTAILYDASLFGVNTIDLMQLKGGVRALIGSGPAEPGLYDRVRVFFSDIAIDYNTPGGTERFSTNDGSLIYGGDQEQGVDFVEFELPDPGVDLDVGENEDILLDFDLAQSIDVQGDPTDPTTITFTPIGQARELTASSGSIQGVVRTDADTSNTTADDTPVANADVTLRQSGVVVARTITDAGGVYVIEGLDAGQYDLLAVDTEDPTRQFQSDVNVNASQATTADALLTDGTP